MSDVDAIGPSEFTVDELARWADLPVRTIREYQTMRLLPAPRRQGRIGLYGQHHAQRLAVIARLQRRGYSLAAIRDLVEARADGTDLAAVLGVDVGPVALDEAPLRLSRTQLRGRVPGLRGDALGRARDAGLVVPDGAHHFLVRSPALLALVGEGVKAGLPIADMLELVAVLRDGLDVLADAVADQVVALLDDGTRSGSVETVLRRGRLLLLQGAVSVLADRLGDALRVRAGRDEAGGARLGAALEAVRVGVVADADGNITRRSRR